MAKSNYIFFIVFFMLFNSLIVNAQWSDDPGVSNWLFYGLISPRATTDNTGNIFVVGQSAGGNWATLWIQKLSADGYILWDSSGVLFAEGLWGRGVGYRHQVPDNQGGIFVTWEDSRMGILPAGVDSSAIYAQYINSEGICQWVVNGIRVFQTPSKQGGGYSISDGKNGILCFSTEGRIDPDEHSEIYGQRIDISSNYLWGQKGKVLVNDSLAAGLIDVVEGLNGSFLMLYLLSYHTNNNSLYLQRFDNNGNPLWGSRGTLVTSDTSTNFHELISDGNNGAFISYTNLILPERTRERYVQKIDSSGKRLYHENGVFITNNPTSADRGLNIALDYYGGIVCGWKDQRDGFGNLYTNRINEQGNLMWGEQGMKISLVDTGRGGLNLISSNDSYYFSWSDQKLTLFGQKFDSTGIRLWDSSDVLVTNKNTGHYDLLMLPAYNGGFVNIWYEFDAESGVGILAKRVNADGTLGNPDKIINSEHPIPESFNVAVYPNPFNDSITIKLWLSKSEDVEISVYTIQGRLVKNIYKGRQKANFKKYFWNSTNQDLSKVSSGLYIINVKSGNFFLSKKIILIR